MNHICRVVVPHPTQMHPKHCRVIEGLPNRNLKVGGISLVIIDPNLLL
jgi:hypothetical protein